MPGHPPLKLAVIGCGDLFIRTLLPRLTSARGKEFFEVVALAGPQSQVYLHDFAGARAFDSFDSFLASPGPAEVAWLLTPAQDHAEQLIALVSSGLNIYVQKPMAGSLSEFDRAAEAVNRARAIVAVAPGQMLSPVLTGIATRLGSGEMGKVFFATAPFMGWAGVDVDGPTDPAWRFATGNGPLRDHGVYGITTLLMLLGAPARVTAFAGIRESLRRWNARPFPVTEPDNIAAILQFRSGAMATLHEAWCPGSATSAQLRIHTMEGSIETAGGQWDVDPERAIVRGVWGEVAAEMTLAALDPGWASLDPAPDAPNRHVWRDVLHHAKCVNARTQPLSSPTRVRDVYRVLDSIFESARRGGEPVAL